MKSRPGCTQRAGIREPMFAPNAPRRCTREEPLVPRRRSPASRRREGSRRLLAMSEGDLLEILDALVQRDGAATGLFGEICVGVRAAAGYRWWRARLGPTFETRFLDRPPQTAHATLFIGEADARALLARGQLPARPELLMIDGDRTLMLRFLRRYTSRTTWLGVQMER